MADHQRKLNDTHTTWTQTLDTSVDLTTASAVTLYVQAPDGTMAVSNVAVTVDDADTVSYQFAAADLSQTGGHDAEFHVDVDGVGAVETLPKNGYYDVQVFDDLAT